MLDKLEKLETFYETDKMDFNLIGYIRGLANIHTKDRFTCCRQRENMYLKRMCKKTTLNLISCYLQMNIQILIICLYASL